MAVHVMSPTTTTQEAALHRSSIPLTFVSGGTTVKIRAIRGGHRLKQRLYDIGLNQGASVRVIKNDTTGPLILAVKADGRLALGRGMAHHILVDAQPTFE